MCLILKKDKFCLGQPQEGKSFVGDLRNFPFFMQEECAVLRQRIATIADGSASMKPPAKAEVVVMMKQFRM